MSIKKDIYTALQAHLMAELSNIAPLPNLVFVDYNRGQFTNPADTLGLPVPGILFNFEQAEYEDETRGVQQGNMVLTFTLGYENYSQMHTDSVDLDIAMQYLDYMELLHQALHGFKPPCCSSLRRLRETDLSDEAGALLVTAVSYTCMVSDASAAVDRNGVLATPNPVVQHKNPLSGSNRQQPPAPAPWVMP